jgi:hypothetical protein
LNPGPSAYHPMTLTTTPQKLDEQKMKKYVFFLSILMFKRGSGRRAIMLFLMIGACVCGCVRVCMCVCESQIVNRKTSYST